MNQDYLTKKLHEKASQRDKSSTNGSADINNLDKRMYTPTNSNRLFSSFFIESIYSKNLNKIPSEFFQRLTKISVSAGSFHSVSSYVKFFISIPFLLCPRTRSSAIFMEKLSTINRSRTIHFSYFIIKIIYDHPKKFLFTAQK